MHLELQKSGRSNNQLGVHASGNIETASKQITIWLSHRLTIGIILGTSTSFTSTVIHQRSLQLPVFIKQTHDYLALQEAPMDQSPSCGARDLPPPKDLSHHISLATRNRQASTVKLFYKYFFIPGIKQLAGGMYSTQSYSAFVVDSLQRPAKSWLLSI